MTWLGPQNYDNLGPDAAELILQAIDQGADAIVGPNWVPEAMDPAFEAVVAAGIPLVIYNAGGIEAADRLGAMNYVGAVDYKSGYAAGEYLAAAGNKNGACVNTLPGAANIEAFCNGFNDGVVAGGGTGSTLQLPATALQGRYHDYYEAFAEAVETGGEPPVTAKVGARTLAVLDAARQSALEGLSVTLKGF